MYAVKWYRIEMKFQRKMPVQKVAVFDACLENVPVQNAWYLEIENTSAFVEA